MNKVTIQTNDAELTTSMIIFGAACAEELEMNIRNDCGPATFIPLDDTYENVTKCLKSEVELLDDGSFSVTVYSINKGT